MHTWLNANKRTLNITKTEFMLIGSDQFHVIMPRARAVMLADLALAHWVELKAHVEV